MNLYFEKWERILSVIKLNLKKQGTVKRRACCKSEVHARGNNGNTIKGWWEKRFLVVDVHGIRIYSTLPTNVNNRLARLFVSLNCCFAFSYSFCLQFPFFQFFLFILIIKKKKKSTWWWSLKGLNIVAHRWPLYVLIIIRSLYNYRCKKTKTY